MVKEGPEDGLSQIGSRTALPFKGRRVGHPPQEWLGNLGGCRILLSFYKTNSRRPYRSGVLTQTPKLLPIISWGLCAVKSALALQVRFSASQEEWPCYSV